MDMINLHFCEDLDGGGAGSSVPKTCSMSGQFFSGWKDNPSSRIYQAGTVLVIHKYVALAAEKKQKLKPQTPFISVLYPRRKLQDLQTALSGF